MADRNFNDTQIAQLAEKLRGTCQSLTDATEQLFDCDESHLSTDDCHALDAEVFCCEFCGWWWEMSEMADDVDWVCQDCSGENK